MQEQLACLLLLTVSVALASVVAAFAISVSEQAINMDDNAQIDKIQDLSQQLLNETQNLYNQLPEESNSTDTTTSP